MKKTGLLILFSALSLNLFAQDFACDGVMWESIKDTVNRDGNPAVELTLSSSGNDLITGYTTFVLLDMEGDTLVRETMPNGWLPTTKGMPVRSYIRDLTESHKKLDEPFSGILVSDYPACIFVLDERIPVRHNGFKPENFWLSSTSVEDSIEIYFPLHSRDTLELYDQDMKVLSKFSITEVITKKDVSKLKEGFYFLRTKGITRSFWKEKRKKK